MVGLGFQRYISADGILSGTGAKLRPHIKTCAIYSSCTSQGEEADRESGCPSAQRQLQSVFSQWRRVLLVARQESHPVFTGLS